MTPSHRLIAYALAQTGKASVACILDTAVRIAIEDGLHTDAWMWLTVAKTEALLTELRAMNYASGLASGEYGPGMLRITYADWGRDD